MEEYVIKQKIQMACFEPRAPEKLIQQVILRAKAVVMGVTAQKQLETAPAENVAGLASRALIGQLAAVSELPEGAQPEQLARQLERQPAFLAALRGGNVAQRLSNGELLQQLTGQKPAAAQAAVENKPPIKAGPEML
jgi:hypothetical protein